ncbi:MAG: tetratricopeptide repeat protein [Lentisphaeria bacterium]|nr:tetratricopeptide repeat protein [Lentisphaeria bacterium]
MNTHNHEYSSGVSDRLPSIAVDCRRLLSKSAFAAGFVLSLVASLHAATFAEQRAAVSRSVATQPESAILSLLKAGLDEGQTPQAIAETRKWLRQNMPEDGMLLYFAGRAAELSGDWKGAVALYQQYLEKADLKSDTADEAVHAVYTILIDKLKDTAAAYTFSRTKGDRLLVCPRAKQFDKWFLDEAAQHPRYDELAVANRLRACVESGLPNDLLIARYDNYFRWLLGRVGGASGFQRDTQVSQELFDACKGLASAMTFNEEVKLYLDWAVSVRFYVQQRLAEKDVAAPIAEAKALLAKYPEYAEEVQLGWAGGTKDNHPNHVGDYKYYWEHQLDAKMAPVVEAAAKLSPIQRAELFASWQPAGYWRESYKLNLNKVKAIQDYLKTNPDAGLRERYISPLTKPWNQYTPEEVLALAPKIEKNRHADTALVRAIAAGITKKTVKDGDKTRIEYGRDLDKMLAALRGPEAWRLSAANFNSRMTDPLWHYCGRPGGNQKRDAEVAKSVEFGKRLAPKLVGKDAPANQRVAEFKKLWNDYNAPQPKISDVSGLMRKVLQFTPEMVPELLRDANPEAQKLVRDAISKGMTGPDPMWKELDWRKDLKTGHYDPLMMAYIQRHRGMTEMKNRFPGKCHPHPLEGEFRKHIANSLKQNKLVPWQVQAWINMQWPEDNAEQVKLMRAMVKSPAWSTMPFEVKFSAREWFKKDAMTAGQIAWIDAADPAIANKDLLALTKEADVTTTIGALSRAIEGIKKSPVRMDIQGIDKLAEVSEDVFSAPEVMDLILEVTDGLRYASDNEAQPFTERLFNYVKKQREPVLISRTATCLWQYGASGSRGRMFEPMKELTTSLLKTNPAGAGILAQNAVMALSHRRGIYGFDPATRVPEMKALAGKTAMELGLLVIPVGKGDPAYPVFRSQGEWMMGNEDTAWDMLMENWDELLPTHRDLSLDYLAWVLQRTIYTRDEVRQEELVKALLAWAREENTPYSLEQRVNLELAYGDIAIQRGMLKEAHQIFSRTQNNKAYKDLLVTHQATLRRVKVERLAKDFEGALKTLSELDMERVPEIWDAIHYARAEVYFDMDEFDDAADELNKILTREPDHAEAKVMLGKVNIKLQKLIDAIELDVVPGTDQDTIVPGEKLKVTLNDPTLAVSGAGTEIEVAVWAKSGDTESFFLRQFGDNKTKFRGEIMVRLGPPKPGDRVLQVIGDDEVYYSYTDRFREKMNMEEKTVNGPITIASNALLMASARKLLSEAEQRVADMEKKMLALTKGKPLTRAAAGGAQAMTAADIEEKLRSGEDVVDEVLEPPVETRVKPGNPIHVRVIDPDASRTDGIDEVAVSVESSSGDSIGRVVLKETETHAGAFEGKIPTAGAQAMAFAENTEPGRNPNMVISPVPDYPAWRPVPVKGATPEFRIDLNDNAPLGEMTLVAKEPGAKLKQFVVMTGMNDQDMIPVGIFPKDLLTVEKPWQPAVTIMNDTDTYHTNNQRSVYDLRELEKHLERGWMTQQYAAGITENIIDPSEAMKPEIPAKVQWKRQDRHHNAHVIYRFRGYFYETTNVTRRFNVDLGKWTPPNVHPSVADPAEYLLAVDGRIITEKPEKPAKAGAPVVLEGEINLRPGLHRFEIWATGWDCRIGFGRDIKVTANLQDPEKLDLCPADFFNPERFPKGMLSHRNAPANVAVNPDGTEFEVTFAPESRARLLKLVLIGQEGPVPALNKISLTQPGGKTVLPVATDYAQLNKNDTLEILVGDKVAVRYVDDRFVTKSKEKHERFLNVSYSTGSVAFQFFEMRKNRGGEMEAYYEKLLRFEYDKPITVTVDDADMDVSVEPDTVDVVIEDQNRKKIKLVATEDGPSTGSFRVTFTPVAGPPAEKNQIQVAEGGTLTAAYHDKENTTPGVPAYRYASIEHAVFSAPKLRLSHTSVTRINPEDSETPPGPHALTIGFTTMRQRRDRGAEDERTTAERARQARAEAVVPRWQMTSEYVDAATPPKGGIAAVQGQTAYVEVEAPYMATRVGSTVSVYFQTDAGRERAAAQRGPRTEGTQPPVFDTTVPGTIKRVAGLLGQKGTGHDRVPQIPIYIGYSPGRSDGKRGDELSRDIFTCSIPLIAGFLPEEGVLGAEEIARRRENKDPIPSDAALVARSGERVHVGVRYTNKDGAEQWVTGTAKVITHPVLDVLNEDYRTTRMTAYVGETLYLRVIDLGGDVSDEADSVNVLMQAKSGAKYQAELREAQPHSGVFKASVRLAYRKTVEELATADPEEYNVRHNGFPVVYGDTIGIRFTNALGQETATHLVTISKGADGSVEPFSKKYDDPIIAMQTQFSLAESYLALARKHRKLGDIKEADLEFERAKQLLAKSMDQLREPQARAQAEYLLGTLTMEEADNATDAEVKETRYRAALSRFMNVTGTYPDTMPASKAQFQTAVVFEKLDEPEVAAQEYVKLAYKYPESEYLATAMAKLGTYFLRSAKGYEKKAKALLAKTDDKDAQFEGTALWKMTVSEYVKSARMFSRLQHRFPSHELAGEAGMRAGQAYMRAERTKDALDSFQRLIKNKSYDGPEIRAQAMYWGGLCYEAMKQDMAAYSMYKRLTYDFPETKWASYARGQLSQDKLLNLETELEIKRVEEGR